MTPASSRLIRAASAIALVPLASGCVTVDTPDKPIEINLNVRIEQEVLVRLQRDVDQLIRNNPDAFPTTPANPTNPQDRR